MYSRSKEQRNVSSLSPSSGHESNYTNTSHVLVKLQTDVLVAAVAWFIAS